MRVYNSLMMTSQILVVIALGSSLWPDGIKSLPAFSYTKSCVIHLDKKRVDIRD